MRVLVGLAAIAVVVAGCDRPSAPKVDERPTTATTSVPAVPDQSKLFFPGAVGAYGLDVSQTDRDHLIELHALRQIDPCGFVDQKTLAANGHGDFSYTYTATYTIGEGAPIAPSGATGAQLRFRLHRWHSKCASSLEKSVRTTHNSAPTRQILV